MIKKIAALFLVGLTLINFFAVAMASIKMTTFWINLLILAGISHLFFKK